MSKNRDLANIIDSSAVMGKNYIINGGFDVWQRGTSFAYSAGSNGYHTADRFSSANVVGAGGQFTVSKSAIGNSNAIRFTTNTISTNLTTTNSWDGLIYKIESQNVYHLNSKTITVSFKIKTNFTGVLSFSLRNSVINRSYVSNFSVTSGVEHLITKTVTLETNTVLTNDANKGMDFVIGFDNNGTFQTATTDSWIAGNYITTSNATNWSQIAGATIDIAELQMEQGSVATAFEHRSYGEELALCQRYFHNYTSFSLGYTYTNNVASDGAFQFSTTMRVSPTISNASFSVGSGLAGTVVVNGITLDGISFINGSANWNVGVPVTLTAFIDAEL